MHLDLSDDEENQAVNVDHEPVKDIDSNCDEIIEVPEYAAEIHKFLKNAEVSSLNLDSYQEKKHVIFLRYLICYNIFIRYDMDCDEMHLSENHNF